MGDPVHLYGGPGGFSLAWKIVVGVGSALLVIVSLAIFVLLRMQLSRRRSGVSTRLSYTAIRKLELASGQNLKFVLDKQGKQVLLGQGSYGEVKLQMNSLHWTPLLFRPFNSGFANTLQWIVSVGHPYLRP